MADVQAVANFFLHLAEEKSKTDVDSSLLTDMELQKMLFFAQGWHLARHGQVLFDSKIEAWEHGPVIPAVYAVYKKYHRRTIHAASVDYDQFTSSEVDTMMDVFRFYENYSAVGLRNLSHVDGSPWSQVYQRGIKHIEIPREIIEAYYKSQPPLETTADRLMRHAEKYGVQIITPSINALGNPILPADDYEDWGEWDDD